MTIALHRPPGQIASGFGMRNGRMHYGVDFSWMRPDHVQDWNVYAAAAGTIVHSRPLGAFGNLTILDHGNDVETYYAHQARFIRTRGNVDELEKLGIIGGSGADGPNTYAPHLHFELRIRGKPVDPMPYFTAGAGGATPIEQKGTTIMRVIRNKTTDEFARVGEHSVLMLTERNAKIEATIWNADKKPFDVSDAGFAQLVKDATDEGQRFAKQIASLIQATGNPGEMPGGTYTFTGTATPA